MWPVGWDFPSCNTQLGAQHWRHKCRPQQKNCRRLTIWTCRAERWGTGNSPTANGQLQIPKMSRTVWGSDNKIRPFEFHKFYYELFWRCPLLTTWPFASLLIMNYVCSAIFAFTKLTSLKHNVHSWCFIWTCVFHLTG